MKPLLRGLVSLFYFYDKTTGRTNKSPPAIAQTIIKIDKVTSGFVKLIFIMGF
jgi:hypothetical protein